MAPMRWGLVAAIVATVWVVPAVEAEIFMYRDRGGTLNFTNAPAGTTAKRYEPVDWYRPMVGGKRRMIYRASQKKDFDPFIHEMSRRYEVDPALVKAVIHAESNFVPYARSPKGAMGLMQLMPATARMHNVQRITDPRQNIQGGVKHLRLLLDRYNGNVRKTLAAYNAGEDAVDRYGGIPPYRETIDYVQRVTSYRELYQRER
jgi:soluble lytic murein transglycosylase-like protein